MVKRRGWFRIGSGVILSLLFLTALPACVRPLVEVTVRTCEPGAMPDKDGSPQGKPCKTDPKTGGCAS